MSTELVPSLFLSKTSGQESLFEKERLRAWLGWGGLGAHSVQPSHFADGEIEAPGGEEEHR